MTRKTLQVVSIGALLILAVAMHVFVHIHLVVLVPFHIFLSTCLAWLLQKPFSSLLALAILLELFSALPFGTITIAVLIPYLLKKVAVRVEADISFSFLTLLLVTAVAQTAVTTFPAWAWGGINITRIQTLPWLMLGLAILITTLAQFAAILFWQNWLMPDSHSYGDFGKRFSFK